MHFKNLKNKIKKASKGVISILLCVLITPFLSIAGGLVELYRYQSATETMQEIIDSSLLSVLGDYDSYLEDRFGLLATSQNSNMSDTFKDCLSVNSNLLGSAVSIDDVNVKGKLSLSDYNALESQILDSSELEVASELALNTFKLQDIIDEIKNSLGVKKLQLMADKTNKLKNLVESIEKPINTADELAGKIEEIKKQLSIISDSENTIIDNYESINIQFTKDGYSGDSECEYITDSNNKNVCKSGELKKQPSYKKYFTNIANACKELENFSASNDGIGTMISEAAELCNDLKEEIEDAKDAIKGFENSSDSDLDECFEGTTSQLQEIIDQVLDELEIDDVKTDLQTISKNEIIQKISTNNYNDLYEYFFKGDYEYLGYLDRTDLTEKGKIEKKNTRKQNIKNLVDNDYNSAFDISDFMTNIFKTFNIDEIKKAKQDINDLLENGLSDKLKTMASSIMGIANMNFFYDPDLNAYLSDENVVSTSNNAYENFFCAVQDLKEAFQGTISLTKLKNIATSITKMLNSVCVIVVDFISSVKELASGDLLNKAIISGYMLYNLPNRLNYSDGTGLTGYNYADINKGENCGEESNGDGIEGINGLLCQSHSNAKTSSMFQGAELEYIVAGTRSEKTNQVITLLQIYFLRMILNIPAIFKDTEVNEMAASASAFSWLVYILVILGEPLCDTLLLVNSEPVDIIKDSCFLTPTGILDFIEKIPKSEAIDALGNSINDTNKSSDESNKNENKNENDDEKEKKNRIECNYEQNVLFLLMLLKSKDGILARFSELVDIEASAYYKEEDGSLFDINRTYCCISGRSKVTYYPFISVFETNNGSSLFQVNYSQDRSY